MPWRPVLVISEFPLNFSPFVRFSVCVCVRLVPIAASLTFTASQNLIFHSARALAAHAQSLFLAARKKQKPKTCFTLCTLANAFSFPAHAPFSAKKPIRFLILCGGALFWERAAVTPTWHSTTRMITKMWNAPTTDWLRDIERETRIGLLRDERIEIPQKWRNIQTHDPIMDAALLKWVHPHICLLKWECSSENQFGIIVNVSIDFVFLPVLQKHWFLIWKNWSYKHQIWLFGSCARFCAHMIYKNVEEARCFSNITLNFYKLNWNLFYDQTFNKFLSFAVKFKIFSVF